MKMYEETFAVRLKKHQQLNIRQWKKYFTRQLNETLLLYVGDVNDNITREAVGNSIYLLLSRLIKGAPSITNFGVVCDETNNTSESVDKNTLVVDFALSTGGIRLQLAPTTLPILAMH